MQDCNKWGRHFEICGGMVRGPLEGLRDLLIRYGATAPLGYHVGRSLAVNMVNKVSLTSIAR